MGWGNQSSKKKYDGIGWGNSSVQSVAKGEKDPATMNDDSESSDSQLPEAKESESEKNKKGQS